MTVSPPGSPTGASPRLSAVTRTPRSNSRLSMSSKHGGGSRASDEDTKTAVKVGLFLCPPPSWPGNPLQALSALETGTN